MKVSHKLVATFAFIAAMLFSTSCKKVIEQVFQSPKTELDFCAIKKITAVDYPAGYPDFPEISHWTFRYNSNGDPISVETDRVGTGYPNVIFRYDSKHRLSDIIWIFGTYDDPGPGFDFWTRITYNSQNRAISAKYYVEGTYGQNPTDYTDVIDITYQYDSEGRLISDLLKYDTEGDLIGPPVYDDKVNMHRTNKVWMFVDQDYSVHNPFIATAYNSFQLPKHVEFSELHHFLDLPYFSLDIQYSCD
jgi:hypothetical protein